MPIEFDRKRLITRLNRWESEYSSAQEPQFTNQAGVRSECFTAVESILRDCHSLLGRICGKAAEDSSRKAFDALTLGERITALEEIVPACRPVLQRVRRDVPINNPLISSDDFKVLRRFNTARVGHAHREERADVLKLIALTRNLSSLPFFDICRRLEIPPPHA